MFIFPSVQNRAQIIPHQFDINPIQCHCLLSSTYSASQLLNRTVREVQILFFLFSHLFALMKNGSCQIWQTAPPTFPAQSYTFQLRIESKSTEIKVKRVVHVRRVTV